MLTIRREQMQAFEQASVRCFENHVNQQLRENDPALCEGLGVERLQNTVALGVNRSRTLYLLSLKQDLVRYIDLMLDLGSYFDIDPQLPWGSLILQDAILSSSRRMINLDAVATSYLEQIQGDNQDYLTAAIDKLHSGRLLAAPPSESDRFSASYVIALLRGLYPEKADFLGDEVMREMLAHTIEAAKRYAIADPKGITLYAGLMFILGSHFDQDPQFPELAAILQDLAISDSEEKVALLFRQAQSVLQNY